MIVATVRVCKLFIILVYFHLSEFKIMDASQAEAGVGTDPDFATEPFTTRREPIQELIHSLSSLYLESKEEAAVPNEDDGWNDLPLPPPIEDDESLISLTIATKVNQLSMRIDKIEKDKVECVRRVEQGIQNHLQRHDHCLKTQQFRDIPKQMTIQAQTVDQNQRNLEEKLTDIIERRCNHLKQVLKDRCKTWVRP